MTFGSFQNLMASQTRSPDPVVGMGATLISWTDRRAATVIAVVNDHEVRIQEDTATRVDGRGMSEAQEYKFDPNPQGHVYVFTRRGDGRWKEKGTKGNGTSVVFGHRSHYYDYSF